MKKFLKKPNTQESGFTLIELMISMGLLTFVMGISMNILSIVLELTNDADYSAVITQESNYASERVKRMVRSAEKFTVSDNGTPEIGDDSLEIVLDGRTHQLTLQLVPGFTDRFTLKEQISGNPSSSILSSEVYIKQFGSEPVFTDVNGIGVRMAFEIYHERDDNSSAGAFVYTQAIGRNEILN